MRFSTVPLFLVLAAPGLVAPAQQASAPAQNQTQSAATHIVGSVTAIHGNSIAIQPDSGAPVTITVSDTARILETQPGAKTLAGATPIQLSDISVGDRVLAAIHPSADGSSATANTVIAMKQSALAQHQQAEQADWQRRGVGGLVKSVDTANGSIAVASGARNLTVHTTPQTIVRRYSPDSIKFSDAQPSTLAQIRPGDQLRARGDRSPGSSEVTADEIVAGTFRNFAGTVVSTDPAANTVTVTDLATKRPVVIHVTSESQMHKLPEQMAQGLAMRLKRAGNGSGNVSGNGSGNGQSQEHPASESSASSSDHPAWRQAGGANGQRGGDLSQMLQRTPAVQLSELHKGDAVMIVATQGTPGSATAVTLVAGVEPILTTSPSASQSMFSASWNLGGGGGGMGEEGTQ
ncbi:MAG TPA: hypothetical protein VFW25_11900 [Silvibacterium sp.]|nr:hypothetical protein [Silvibacterium sp.]